ncbi:glutathione S-transferase family protein [Methylomonas koyamae]|uniref:Glutathione S-transferase n=1 Tax=Methylomonas koyamae TaxID=702114 RepID=A0A291INI0_9GAMM|nr:glutathione S-transferase family protein [Methylomonas koyamae]ATG91768.1 glutathione S-transferase [Methylomonas koyamae]OAI27687.1 glutathione S-transferase [Methylomonas koyamae]
MKLYDMELSGNCYKIRLLCGLLGIDYERVPVDLMQGQHKTEDFLRLNPRGQIPVLEDAGALIWDSSAILLYLARQYGGEQWLPLAAKPMAEVMQWLSLAQNELLYGLARARAAKKFNRPWDVEQCQQHGRLGLQVLERQLATNVWLAGSQPTIADIACYPYVALAPEGGVALAEFPAVLAWMQRIRELPGYVAMPGIGAD